MVNLNAEIYSPPYLFDSNGQKQARPMMETQNGARRQQTFEARYDRGFSTTARTNKRCDQAVLNVQIDVLKRLERSVPKAEIPRRDTVGQVAHPKIPCT